MSDQQQSSGLPSLPGYFEPVRVGRRLFLRYASAAVGGVMVAGCMQDHAPNTMVDLGSGDVGILNYAYALEQLEAAFYTKVVSDFYSGATDAEKAILTDIRDHEIIHREFFKAALGNNGIIPDLTPNFNLITFSDRASVLEAAKAFEDLGVAAYNGAGPLIQNAAYLLIAGKIVSVEARHAAAIRDLLMPKTASFSGDDVVDPVKGLDMALKPAMVLSKAQMYVQNPISGANLPM